MTRQEIKFAVQKYTPRKLFEFLYGKIYEPFLKNFLEKQKTKKLHGFKNEKTVNFDFDDIEFKINIDPSNGTVDNEIFLQGVYEPSFLKILHHQLEEGDTFVDIGANIGQHSLFASRAIGDTGKVIAFEPVPKIYNQFKRSVERNGFKNIQIHNLACGDEDKDSFIYTSSSNMGGSSILFSSHGRVEEKIKIVRGDTYLQQENKIDLIKIDVEGYEYEALLGIRGTLEKHKPKLIIEYSYDAYKTLGGNRAENILSILFSLGYKLIDIDNNNREIILTENGDNLKYFNDNKVFQTNILCTYRQ